VSYKFRLQSIEFNGPPVPAYHLLIDQRLGGTSRIRMTTYINDRTTYIAKAGRIMAGTISTALVLFYGMARADVVLDWNAIMQNTVAGQAPFIQARFAAITQLAVFEAVNAITRDYKPYAGANTAPADASSEAAAITAAHTVLKNYFPGSAAALDAARAASLAIIPDGPAKNSGIRAGEAAAAVVIAARSNDGSAPPEFYVPASSRPGEWQSTPSCTPAGGAFFHWRNVKPFAIRSADQFRLDAPPALDSTRYVRDYNEVKVVGAINSNARPQDRSDVARFYGTVSPVAVWNSIARQLSIAAGKSLSENARAFALLNMAMSDGAVATFDTKYKYNSWRPETAIRMGNTDGNQATDADPSFTPFIAAPCFPGYPSAHATLSNSAREVLERLYGARRRSLILSNPAVPGITLRYNRLKAITEDIDDARVYGGIHFRFEQDAGADLGRRVGEYVYKYNFGVARAGCEDE